MEKFKINFDFPKHNLAIEFTSEDSIDSVIESIQDQFEILTDLRDSKFSKYARSKSNILPLNRCNIEFINKGKNLLNSTNTLISATTFKDYSARVLSDREALGIALTKAFKIVTKVHKFEFAEAQMN